jgi:hypothetical protein
MATGIFLWADSWRDQYFEAIQKSRLVNDELEHGSDPISLLSGNILGGTEKTHESREASRHHTKDSNH